MAEISHLENRRDVIFLCWRRSDLDKFSQTGAEWHVDCSDMVEIESICLIKIWRTFGRIQWHVIPEPRMTLQRAATWWIHFTIPEPHATLQGVRILSPILKIVFRHILCIFVFLMLFGLWRAAAFVSSPIHLFVSLLVCLSVAKMQKKHDFLKN